MNKTYKKEYHKKWYEKNKEKKLLQNKLWKIANKDKYAASNKAYRSRPDIKAKMKILQNNWINANLEKRREYIRAYDKTRELIDIQFKLRKRTRNRLFKIMRSFSIKPRTVELLGCSLEYLKLHLESKFKEGMSWSNYGEWHIDHIEPLCSFDLTIKKSLFEACNFKNLQPMWANDNFIKGIKERSQYVFDKKRK